MTGFWSARDESAHSLGTRLAILLPHIVRKLSNLALSAGLQGVRKSQKGGITRVGKHYTSGK